jgi:dihydrofolate synthase/folylpolyglutamate synthase
MNYKETIEWLFKQLPMYQTHGAIAYKEDLTNTLLLAKYLGNPEKNQHNIHVAGTNGKGSTSHLIASVLQEAGYKVGLFTSPHLKDFKERIKINGKEISEKYICDFVIKNKHFFEENKLSFFEMSVGLAFEYFKNQKTNINIIEVGLGGRLDATNIIHPLVSVITNIGLDHVQYLGNTLEKIAFEKAGIIKEKTPIVIGEYTSKTKAVFIKKASELNAPIFFANEIIKSEIPSDLLGDYQLHNKKTAMQVLDLLKTQFHFKITEIDINNGFLNVIKNTGLQGRWQKLNDNPKVICDTAHNQHGLKIVLNQIKKEKYYKLHVIIGFVNDKNLDEILPLFPKNAIYYFCKPNNKRGLNATILEKKGTAFGLKGKVYSSVLTAYKTALANAEESDFIYIGGSTFIVSEIV